MNFPRPRNLLNSCLNNSGNRGRQEHVSCQSCWTSHIHQVQGSRLPGYVARRLGSREVHPRQQHACSRRDLVVLGQPIRHYHVHANGKPSGYIYPNGRCRVGDPVGQCAWLPRAQASILESDTMAGDACRNSDRWHCHYYVSWRL
jgi:hypothetical protein